MFQDGMPWVPVAWKQNGNKKPGSDHQPCPTRSRTNWHSSTGRAARSAPLRADHIDPILPPILTRLHIDAAAWRQTMHPHGSVFGRALGRLDHRRLHARALGQPWRGLRHCERLYDLPEDSRQIAALRQTCAENRGKVRARVTSA